MHKLAHIPMHTHAHGHARTHAHTTPAQDADGNTPLHVAVRMPVLGEYAAAGAKDAIVEALLMPGRGWDVPTLVKVRRQLCVLLLGGSGRGRPW